MDEFKFPTIRLSAEEEKEVALRAENGDKEARELLILSCVPFARKYSKCFHGHFLDAEELFEEALIGLVIAADKFDVHKGFRFNTYAKYCICTEIRNALNFNKKTIPLIKNKNDPDELLELVHDSFDTAEAFVKSESKKSLLKAIKNLKPIERDVVSMHYGLNGKEPKSFTEIGESKGYTKVRMHQIEKKAFLNLQKSLEGLWS